MDNYLTTDQTKKLFGNDVADGDIVAHDNTGVENGECKKTSDIIAFEYGEDMWYLGCDDFDYVFNADDIGQFNELVECGTITIL